MTATVVYARNHPVDYLRGFLAICVMLFHYMVLMVGVSMADTPITRICDFGVPIFYTLSGMCLFNGYQYSLEPGVKSVSAFFVKRFFKIFPLLWLTLIAKLVLLCINRHILPDWRTMLINFSGIFSFWGPERSISTEQWAVGNELIFYLFFPFFLFLSRRSRVWFLVCSLATILPALYFTCWMMNAHKTMAAQQGAYYHPFNHFFFFVGGMWLVYLGSKMDLVKYRRVVTGILLGCIALLFLYPTVSGADMVVNVLGYKRVLFSLATFGVCFGFFYMHVRFTGLPDKLLLILGESSYAVYLLHILVLKYLLPINKWFHLPIAVVLIISGIGTVVCSYIVTRKIGLPLMLLGKKLARKMLTTSFSYLLPVLKRSRV